MFVHMMCLVFAYCNIAILYLKHFYLTIAITQLTSRKRYNVMDITRRSITSYVNTTSQVNSSALEILVVALSNDTRKFFYDIHDVFLPAAVVNVQQHNPLPTRRMVKVAFVEASPRTMNLLNQRVVEDQEHQPDGHGLFPLNERQSRRAVPPVPRTRTYIHHLQCQKGMIPRS